MRITELFTAKSIELDSAASNRDEILSRLVELQATHGNITDTEAYKKALYAREDEASTYVDNGITVPHAKTNVVTRPSLAALRLSTPVQYNAEDDGKTDLLFAIAAPENGSLHVDMLAPAREEITGLFLRRDWSFVLQTDFNSLPASERVGAGRA